MVGFKFDSRKMLRKAGEGVDAKSDGGGNNPLLNRGKMIRRHARGTLGAYIHLSQPPQSKQVRLKYSQLPNGKTQIFEL